MQFRKFFLIFLMLFTINCAYGEINPIDAQRNAKEHNNQGTIYLREGDYLAAIKEFKIAIGINPNAQSTSVYYNNLGRTYMKIYEYNKNRLIAKWAQDCFEHAILGDCMNMVYYNNLVESYAAQGILDSRAQYLIKRVEKNPYNKIIVGLIYLKQNKIGAAITMLDDFCTNNPDLIITNDVKKIIKANSFI